MALTSTWRCARVASRRVDTLIVCKGSNDVGVASTVYAAPDLDNYLVIASDACTPPEPDNHLQFIERVFPRMVLVRSVAQIVAMLEAGGRSRRACRRQRPA